MARGREALSRLPRRTRQREGPDRARPAACAAPTGRRAPAEYRGPGAATPKPRALGPLDRARRSLLLVVLVVVWGVLGWLSVSERRPRREQAARRRTRRPRSRRRAGCSSRTRRRSCCSAPTTRTLAARPATGTRTRSCCSAPTRRTTGSTTSRSRATCIVPIPGHGTQKINAAFQIGGAAARDQDDPRVHRASTIDHVDRRQLRRLQGPDRRGRRDRHRRAEADPLEPLRLPVLDAGAVREVAGLAVREGHAAHERRAGADLLADPREPARPGRERHHARRAPAGGDGRRDREARVGSGRSSSCRSTGGSYVKPLTTDLEHERAHRARLGQVPRVDGERGALPARRRPRRRRHAAARARTTRRRSRCSSASRRPSRRPIRSGPAASSGTRSSDAGQSGCRRSSSSSPPDDEPEPDDESDERTGRRRVRRRGVGRSAAPSPPASTCARSRSSRSLSPCSGPRPDGAPAAAAPRRRPRRRSGRPPSCRGRPRRDARSGTCTRRSARERQGYQRPPG